MTPNTKFEFKSLQSVAGWRDVSYVPMPKPTRFDGVAERIMDADEQRRQFLEMVDKLLWDPRTFFNGYPRIYLDPLRPWQDSVVDHFRDGLRFSMEMETEMYTGPIPPTPGKGLLPGFLRLVDDPRLEDGEWFLAHPGQVRAWEEGWFCEGSGGKSIVFSDGEGEDGPS